MNSRERENGEKRREEGDGERRKGGNISGGGGGEEEADNLRREQWEQHARFVTERSDGCARTRFRDLTSSSFDTRFETRIDDERGWSPDDVVTIHERSPSSRKLTRTRPGVCGTC